jgi:uncharacterized protein (TIGR02246 family)
MHRILILFTFVFSLNCLHALEEEDRLGIQDIINEYVDSWNLRECKGFGDGFTEDADFVNIFGMHFIGRTEIEERHLRILQTFLKGSQLEILNTQLREVQPGLVIAIIHWNLKGFRSPGTDLSQPGEAREGVFSHVFIKSEDKWEITATQNTLIPKR